MNVKEALAADQWRGAIEFSIEERSPERVVAKMPIQPGIINAFGTVHAGALIWFADVAATLCAVDSPDAVDEDGHGFPLAVDLHTVLIGNERDGILTAESKPVRRGRTLIVIRTIVTGPTGKQLMDMTTTHMAAR